MNDREITWMVLVRDVPRTIQVRGHDHLSAAMVLDTDTGLVRGVAVEGTVGQALHHAFGMALSSPAAELRPGWPQRVLCPSGFPAMAADVLGIFGSVEQTPVVEVQAGDEAEEIFDSFLGHMAGRAQPDESPTPADWRVLIEGASAFRAAKPWLRWSDEQDLAVELHFPGGATAPYTAVVMGQAGVQRGVVFYPGQALPARMRADTPSEQAPTPPDGTLLFTLDPVDEPPADLTAKALRYGWPVTDELVPVFMTFTPSGGAEIGRQEAWELTAGIAAVVGLDRRGPRLADPARAAVAGTANLADGRIDWRIEHRPTSQPPDEPALRLHLAGRDLIPDDTPVTVGHLSWAALPKLRAAARVHRPAPPDAPAPSGRELPLVVIHPEPDLGTTLVSGLAELDLYGVGAVDADDGKTVLVLAGGNAAEMLIVVPSGSPALAAFHRRLRQTKGRHVVLVADAASRHGEGAVYGLFECHQPPPPASPSRKPRRTPPGKSGTARR